MSNIAKVKGIFRALRRKVSDKLWRVPSKLIQDGLRPKGRFYIKNYLSHLGHQGPNCAEAGAQRKFSPD